MVVHQWSMVNYFQTAWTWLMTVNFGEWLVNTMVYGWWIWWLMIGAQRSFICWEYLPRFHLWQEEPPRNEDIFWGWRGSCQWLGGAKFVDHPQYNIYPVSYGTISGFLWSTSINHDYTANHLQTNISCDQLLLSTSKPLLIIYIHHYLTIISYDQTVTEPLWTILGPSANQCPKSGWKEVPRLTASQPSMAHYQRLVSTSSVYPQALNEA